MNVEYGNSNNQPIIKFLPYVMGDPNAFSKSHDAEMIRKYGRRDPLKPPKKERGDVYIILGVITGAIIGGVLGSFWTLLTLFIGIIIGAIIGATAGNFVKKRRQKKV